ncbi:DUF4870 family protein [Parapedomonas caeni]
MNDQLPDNPVSPPPSGQFKFNSPTIVSLLYLAGFVLGGLPSILGVILSYVWKGEPHPGWQDSHFQLHIRTFWFGLAQAVVGFLLIWIGIGVLVFLWLLVWTGVRTIKALLAAQKEQPLPNPETLLW